MGPHQNWGRLGDLEGTAQQPQQRAPQGGDVTPAPWAEIPQLRGDGGHDRTRDLPANSQREPPDTKKKVSMSVSGPSPARTASQARGSAASEPPPLPPPPPPGIFSPRLPAPLRRPGGRGRAQRALLSEPDSQPRSAAGTPGQRDSGIRTAEPDGGRGWAARPATFWGKRARGRDSRAHCRSYLTAPPTNDPYLHTTGLQGFMARQAQMAAGVQGFCPRKCTC